jgi:hypothetical protein
MIEAQCMCGAVQFAIDGPVRNVIVCHCSICRRLHGGAAAYSNCRAADLDIRRGDALRWFAVNRAEYGFCSECGSRLFWRRAPVETVSFNAACLPAPTGLRTTHHIWVGSAGDYEDLTTELPCQLEAS